MFSFYLRNFLAAFTSRISRTFTSRTSGSFISGNCVTFTSEVCSTFTSGICFTFFFFLPFYLKTCMMITKRPCKFYLRNMWIFFLNVKYFCKRSQKKKTLLYMQLICSTFYTLSIDVLVEAYDAVQHI